MTLAFIYNIFSLFSSLYCNSKGLFIHFMVLFIVNIILLLWNDCGYIAHISVLEVTLGSSIEWHRSRIWIFLSELLVILVIQNTVCSIVTHNVRSCEKNQSFPFCLSLSVYFLDLVVTIISDLNLKVRLQFFTKRLREKLSRHLLFLFPGIFLLKKVWEKRTYSVFIRIAMYLSLLIFFLFAYPTSLLSARLPDLSFK